MGTKGRGVRPVGRILAGTLAGFLITTTGCSAEPPLAAVSEASPVSPIGEQVFAVGYDRIAEIYLQPVDMGRLTLDGLSALTRLDPEIKVNRQGTQFVLAAGETPIGDFSGPAAGDSVAWASVTARIIDRARSVSAILGQTSQEEIYETVFTAITADLDVYSRYTSASKATSERAQREGYGGVGIGIEGTDGRYRVDEVVNHAPADRAGVRAGTRILAVDGELTAYMTPEDIQERLRGPAGSLVLVTLADSDDGPQRRVALRRERVIPNTVTLSIDDNVAVLRIDRFNAATSLNLREKIEEARQKLGTKIRGFALDLRGNPGGLLDQAVAVADLFIPRGRIVSTAGRHPDSMQHFDASADDLLSGLPLVVLVDGRSASASEIVAAALQDSARAIVIGASSYGKGSVQTVTRLPNDGELFLTWSQLYAPSGYTLHRQGVTPTICTSNDLSSVEEVVLQLKDGRLMQPSDLARWRAAAPADETALTHLREACPWKDHETELDLQVAKRLIVDSSLYQRAMQISSTLMAER